MKNAIRRMRLYHVTFAIVFVAMAALAVHPCWAADARLELIRPSEDGSHFVRAESGTKFVAWGFNYDHDHSGRLLEDYWHK